MAERGWLSIIKYSTNFLKIYLNTFSEDDIAKKLVFLNMQFTLINIALYSSFL